MTRTQSEYLKLIYALCGCVTKNFRAVWFELANDSVDVTILLSEELQIDLAACREFEENYGAQIENSSDKFNFSSIVSNEELRNLIRDRNLIFCRKEP